MKRNYLVTMLLILLSLLFLTACGEEFADEEFADEGFADEGFDYYETEEDCFDDEVYDPVDQLCYFEWECVDGECEEISLEDELWGILGDLLTIALGLGNEELGDIEDAALVTYDVEGNNIANPENSDLSDDESVDFQNDTASHQEIWTLFTRLIPQEERPFVSKFVIFTDGKDQVLAAVMQDEDDPTQWVLAVDIADIEDQKELTYTLIHEYGHLLTLNERQIEIDPDLFFQQDNEDVLADAADACSTFFPGEGCSLSDSYINLFVEEFWADLEGELAEIESIDDEDEYYEALDDFYYNYEDQFVTDYAATNPAEDIAESWTAFVLKPKPDGDTIAEEKVLFFYDFPELVQLRRDIIGRTYSRLRR